MRMTTTMGRMRPGALAALVAAAACGGGGAQDGAAADSAAGAADTSAIAVARTHLGDEVPWARGFRVGSYDARFIATALPAAEGERSEIVLLEMADGPFAISKPGLFAGGHGLAADSAGVARLAGVEDADGDGDPEVWAAEWVPQGGSNGWIVRAYDRGGRALYELTASTAPAGGGEARTYEFSPAVEANPAMRTWLAAKAEALDARMPADGTDGSGR